MADVNSWILQFESKKDDLTRESEKIKQELRRLLEKESIVISSRIKGSDSLKEKIIRNKYFQRYTNNNNIFDFLKDGIGIRIICLEQKNEDEIYKKLLALHSENKFTNFGFVDSSISTQPEYQKNGHAIYRINAKASYITFEIQIKSTTHMLWGEVEHLLFYKNYDSYIGSKFLRDQIEQIYIDLISINNRLSNLREYMRIDSISATNQELIEITTKMLQENVQESLLPLYYNVKLDFRLLYTAITQEYYYSAKRSVSKKKKRSENSKSKIKYDDFAKVLSAISELDLTRCNLLEVDINFEDISQKTVADIANIFCNKIKKDVNKDEWILFFNITSQLLKKNPNDMIVSVAERLRTKFRITIDNEFGVDLTNIEKNIAKSVLEYFSNYGDFLMLDEMFIEAIEVSIQECIELILQTASETLGYKEDKSLNAIKMLVNALIYFEYGKKVNYEEFNDLIGELGLRDICKLKASKISYSKVEFIEVLERGIQ